MLGKNKNMNLIKQLPDDLQEVVYYTHISFIGNQ